MILPACGIAVAGYTLFKHLSPVPESPYDLFPYIVAAWLAVGLVVTFLVPGSPNASPSGSRLHQVQSSPSSRARSTASERVAAGNFR